MLPPLKIYGFLLFAALLRVGQSANDVRPRATIWIYALPPKKKINRFMHFDLFAAAATNATTAIEMATPQDQSRPCNCSCVSLCCCS